jgi:aryl-alcohol dehydrogenase-like predicted oxidoreductase
LKDSIQAAHDVKCRNVITFTGMRYDGMKEDEAAKNCIAVWQEVMPFAQEKGVTPAQLALAWLLAQGDDIVPIPGTKRRQYLEENVAAVAIELSPAELERLNTAAPQGAAVGDRYADMSTVNR